MSIIEAFVKTISFFDDLKKEGLLEDYALIGGLALSAWVRPRTTKDVDLAVAVSKKNYLGGHNFYYRNQTSQKGGSSGTRRSNIKEKLSFISGQIEVDLISTRGFELASAAVKNAVVAEVFGRKVKVVTPEYIILLKPLPLSSQDAVDIKTLLKKADKVKLISIARQHYLLPKLESVISNIIQQILLFFLPCNPPVAFI